MHTLRGSADSVLSWCTSDTSMDKDRGIRPGSGSRQSRDLPVDGKKLVIRQPHHQEKQLKSGAPKNTLWRHLWMILYLTLTGANEVDTMTNSTKRNVDWRIPTTIAEIGKSEVSLEGSRDLLKMVLKDDTEADSRVLRVSRTSLFLWKKNILEKNYVDGERKFWLFEHKCHPLPFLQYSLLTDFCEQLSIGSISNIKSPIHNETYLLLTSQCIWVHWREKGLKFPMFATSSHP